MQLSFDAADTLVDLVEARGGAVAAGEAARVLFALSSAPVALARSLLDDVVGGDARLAWRGDSVALAPTGGLALAIEGADWVVFDLETTGLSASTCRICEIGAQRVRTFELTDTFETLVNPRTPLPPAVQALTGIGQRELRGAPPAELAVRRFLDFAGNAVLVAHNARFDMAFLDREVMRLSGRRVAAPVVDTVWLARRLLAGRIRRVGLAPLSHLLGTSVQPCHRALPDAQATAEILVQLLGLAQERGARTVADVVELATPKVRALNAKRTLVVDAPRGPGVYLFRDRRRQVLYVGRARDLRDRLRSYFAGERQRPAVEAALGALDRVEWRQTGSELEAALEEVRLLRELRPPANARGKGGREAWLVRRGSRWSVVSTPEPAAHGPVAGTSLARRAARALDGHETDEPAAALPSLRGRLGRLARDQRFEDAARLRDRIAALEAVVERLEELRRLRALRVCLVAPASQAGFVRAVFVADGRLAAERILPLGGGAAVELDAALAEISLGTAEQHVPDDALLSVVSSFVRRPPPELTVVPLDRQVILGALGQRAA